MKLKRFFAVALYYGFARYLPVSYSPLSLGLTKPFRAFLCRYLITGCGKNVNIEKGATFGYNLTIGDNSGIGINAQLNTGGGITIGKNVMMGRDVIILTQNHAHNDISQPMTDQGYDKAPVTIEDDVWIGLRVIILPGVTIGKSSVIGAGAVVSKDVPPFSVAAGNPARIVKTRGGKRPQSSNDES